MLVLETSKIENVRHLDFPRPRAAHQVCVEKARLFLHKLGAGECVTTRALISLRKSKQVAEDV